MKKILIFAAFLAACVGFANAGVRSGASKSRNDSAVRVTTTARPTTTTARTTTLTSVPRSGAQLSTRGGAQNRAARSVSARTATVKSTPQTGAGHTVGRAAISSGRTVAATARAAVARAADSNAAAMSETRTGAAYERCKNAYFTCMDQFCQLKNDDYRRCSCNDRVLELAALRDTLQGASDKLDAFNENLDVVGMTAAQATAMLTASDGERALANDKSSSKAILQAIMNSIRGGDASVSGQYSDLNSIDISFDTANAFGNADSGQIIASYNGQSLYNAVYPQCRSAVRADCNDASLQRAINAYLMAVESDCNTVQTAIANQQKQLKAAVREGSAMLDLARVENRQKHNSDDLTACVNNVEAAIVNEEVCGANYHKCLDNGEFIDVSTGKPIAGVTNFNELGTQLTFNSGVSAAEQKLSQVVSNRRFVTNFEARVKKFAEPALDKCVELSETAWAEYLDKALLSIYYAQRAKVDEIKQGCFDFVSACYMNGDTSITNAMAGLTGDENIVLQPGKIALNTKLCSDYITSCNNMFTDIGDNIIVDYIQNRQDTDMLTACRAVAKQCFDKFGGKNYENFYYPYSGLFTAGENEPSTNAMQWFVRDADISKCYAELQAVDACNDATILETAFGGFESADKAKVGQRGTYIAAVGVATEVYNQITDILMTQCTNMQGKFIERDAFETKGYKDYYQPDTKLCMAKTDTSGKGFNVMLTADTTIASAYNISNSENMCPKDYALSVDVTSWGICSCWENGARRSRAGVLGKCAAELPVVNQSVVACSTDSDCDSGLVCAKGLCNYAATSVTYTGYTSTESWNNVNLNDSFGYTTDGTNWNPVYVQTCKTNNVPTDSLCPVGYECHEDTADPSYGICGRLCTTSNDCSDGYTCENSWWCKYSGVGGNFEYVPMYKTEVDADLLNCYIGGRDKYAPTGESISAKLTAYVARNSLTNISSNGWCTQKTFITKHNQVCPYGYAHKTNAQGDLVDGGDNSCCKCRTSGSGYNCAVTDASGDCLKMDKDHVPYGV
ncbi:MAG: hypothetical protein IJ560_03610 [Alphaproteobacteria bacterium]|nr:hypothetical protein [Alphaproteobacteria bacterium]